MPDRNRAYDKSTKGQEYRNRYQREHYTRIVVLAQQDEAERISKAAEEAGQTRTQFVLTAVREYMKKRGTE